MRTSYLVPTLLLFFLVTAAGWFVGTAPQRPAATDSGEVARASRTAGSPRGMGMSRAGRSPFLVAHEQGTAFVPSGDNLAPGFHVEMEAIRQRLDAAPQDTSLLLRMAHLKHDGHQLEEAVAYYERYVDLRPDGRAPWLDLARCLGELGRWDEALTATETLLERFPGDPAGLYNQGAIFANLGRLDEARTVWQDVSKQDANPEMQALAADALDRLDAMHP